MNLCDRLKGLQRASLLLIVGGVISVIGGVALVIAFG